MMPLRVEGDPGTVTINGQITYEPRNWHTLHIMNVGKEVEVDLYERDHNGDNFLLTTTSTNCNGEFTFTVTNYWGPLDPKLNTFYRVRLRYPETNPKTAVTRPGLTDPYYIESDTTYLSTDGNWTINFAINSAKENFQAMWIFEDLRNAWDYVYANDIRNGVHHDPGEVVAYWALGSNSYLGIYNSYATPDFIFIADNTNASMDVAVHETGHKFMANGEWGWWYPYPDCWTHYMFGVNSQGCAWSEGWADFFAMAVNQDPCYNFTSDPCGGSPDGQYYNLELHSRVDDPGQFPWDDSVEGRVASTLYDLYDSQNEGFDMIYAGFAPISQLALNYPGVHQLRLFWYEWNATSYQDYLKSGLTFWWNTVNYANIQQVFLPVIKK